MNLKSIVCKFIASTIVVYMGLGGILATGLQLEKVIAEELKTPEILIEQSNKKYIQYSKDVYKGAIVEQNIKISEVCNSQSHLPIQKMQVQIEIPRINEILPERISIIKASTVATNGKEEAQLLQDYNKENGLLNISYENQADDKGNIYTEFKENAKDEFEIIYIYPQEAYLENAQEVELKTKIKALADYKTENEIVTVEKVNESKTVQKENIGEITNYEITNASEILKGFMYANEASKTNYATEYKTTANLSIMNSQLVDEIRINLAKSNFTTKVKNEIVSSDAIIYKSSSISEKDFNKIFGQNGYIDFYLGNTKYATIKYLDADDQGNRNFATLYSDGIKENDIQPGKVEYPDNTKEVILKTSKPQTEGNASIEVQKQIKGVSDYSHKVELLNSVTEANKIETVKNDIVEQDKKDQNGNLVYDENGNVEKESITKTTQINFKENVGTISLKEPESKVDITSNLTNFSTLSKNDVMLTAVLRSDDSRYKLFENPKIEISLPQEVENIQLGEIQLLYLQNTLKIAKCEVIANKIIIELKGKQEHYNIGAIQEGATIIIPFTMTINNLTPTKASSILVNYTNNNKQREEKREIINTALNSKYGLFNMTTLSGYKDNASITAIDQEEKRDFLEVSTNQKTVTLEANLINNYGEAVENMTIIGKLPSKGNKYENGQDIGNSINTKLATQVNALGVNAKVYYSDNENANKQDSSWTEQATNKSKAYKIVLKEKFEKQKVMKFRYDFIIPENLQYNEKAISTYDVSYSLNGSNYSEKTTLTLATAEAPKVKINVVPNTTQSYFHSGQIVEYIIKAKNIGDKDINNLIIENIVPDQAIYTEYRKGTESIEDDSGVSEDYQLMPSIKTKSFTISELKKGETTEIPVLLKIKDGIKEEMQINNVVNAKTVLEDTGKMTKIAEGNASNSVKTAKLNISLNSVRNTVIKLSPGESYYYYIEVKNISSEELKNIKVKDILPDNLIYKDAYSIFDDETCEKNGYDTYEEAKDEQAEYIKNERKVEWTIKTLKPGEKKGLILNATVGVKGIEEQTSISEIDNVVNVEVGDVVYESNHETNTVENPLFTIKQSTKTNTNILEKDNVTYDIEISNIGKVAGTIDIMDNIPDELKFNKAIYGIFGKESSQMSIMDNNLKMSYTIEAGETLLIHLICTANELEEGINNKEISNQAKIILCTDSEGREISMLSNILKNVIEQNPELDEDNSSENIKDPDDTNDENSGNNNPESGDNEDDNNNPNDKNPGDDNDNQNPEEEKKYSIRGKAWVDKNKDGKREENEEILSSIKVMVIDADTGKLITNTENSIYYTSTNENGDYIIEGLKKGNYIVAFEYDTSKYTVTAYKKSGVDDLLNSDVINKNIYINGANKLVALTDSIKINTVGISNIDIGLIENAKFDLSLDKQISSITVTNAQGTKTTEYENQNFTKIDLVAKYMNDTNLIIKYKFVIKNEGDVTGYVDRLVDNLPSGLEFSSELNKEWYKGNDGNLYTTSLNGIEIQPGQTSEIELILTKKTTESTAGVFSNNAELDQISNIEAIEEKEQAKENNKSSADLVISIKTGTFIMYTGITLISVALIAIGAYLIKTRVLTKKY